MFVFESKCMLQCLHTLFQEQECLLVITIIRFLNITIEILRGVASTMKEERRVGYVGIIKLIQSYSDANTNNIPVTFVFLDRGRFAPNCGLQIFSLLYQT